jgi:toxin YoeB
MDSDPAMLERINRLIEEARRTPFTGLGKPEPLKGEFAGFWSRRINGEHRLIYRVAGHAGADQQIEIASCRYHYGDT